MNPKEHVMKKLFLMLAVLFTASAFADDVGRVNLALPKGEWITVSSNDTALAYGGALPGNLQAGATVRALVGADKTLMALLFIRAGSHGISKGTMQWNLGCKKDNTEYLVDATSGSFTRLDCLRVWRAMNPEAWLKKSAQKAYADLDKLGVKYEAQAFQIVHNVGTDNGTFVFTNAIVSYGTLRNIPDAAKGAKYAGMPGVAWGHLFADAVRSSTRTLSGELVVPQIDYR
jgi:hypothetical protein